MKSVAVLLSLILLTELMAKEEISEAFSKAERMVNQKNFKEQLKRQRDDLVGIQRWPMNSYKIPAAVSSHNSQNYLPDAELDFNKKNSEDSEAPLIFITLSMPTAEIKALLDEASKIGGVVVVRGFYKDLKSTLARAQELSLDNGFIIDPTMFKKYQIKQVPAFILPLSPNEFVSASGSVSLNYFLELIIRTGTKAEVLAAKKWVAK
jgi:type-F conjugative transfer system pilin assembly protein TrbC